MELSYLERKILANPLPSFYTTGSYSIEFDDWLGTDVLNKWSSSIRSVKDNEGMQFAFLSQEVDHKHHTIKEFLSFMFDEDEFEKKFLKDEEEKDFYEKNLQVRNWILPDDCVLVDIGKLEHDVSKKKIVFTIYDVPKKVVYESQRTDYKYSGRRGDYFFNEARTKLFKIINYVISRDEITNNVLLDYKQENIPLDFIEDLLEPKSKIKIPNQGKTGVVYEAEEKVFKFNSLDKNQNEKVFYQLGAFRNNKAKFIELKVHENISALVLKNEKQQGFKFQNYEDTFYSYIVSQSKDNLIFQNLKLMSLFHKEYTAYLNRKVSADIGNTVSHSLSGEELVSLANVPSEDINLDKATRYELFGSVDDKLLRNISRILNTTYSYIKENKTTVVHRDWKLDNQIIRDFSKRYDENNILMIDFESSGFGSELEDVTYFLAEPFLRLSIEEIRNYTNTYFSLRSKNNERFKDPRRLNNFMKWKDNVLLSQLMIRFSCMRKRDLNIPEKRDNRLFLKEQIKQHLATGKFL